MAVIIFRQLIYQEEAAIVGKSEVGNMKWARLLAFCSHGKTISKEEIVYLISSTGDSDGP